MASEEAFAVSLGRSCKAKAMAKAKTRLFIAEHIEQVQARDVAEELRAELVEVEFNTAWHNAASSEPSPWADMGPLDATAESVVHSDTRGEGSPWADMGPLDATAESVVHSNTRGEGSTSMPAGIGVPCTECHRQHRGVCRYDDLLFADLEQLKTFAEHFVPPRPEYCWLRDALYTLMRTIHRNLACDEVTSEKFRELRASVVTVMEQCYLYVP